MIELRDRIGPIDGTAESPDLSGLTAVAPWRDQLANALATLSAPLVPNWFSASSLPLESNLAR